MKDPDLYAKYLDKVGSLPPLDISIGRQAFKMLKASLSVGAKSLGFVTAGFLAFSLHEAKALEEQGKYEEAEKLREEALAEEGGSAVGNMVAGLLIAIAIGGPVGIAGWALVIVVGMAGGAIGAAVGKEVWAMIKEQALANPNSILHKFFNPYAEQENVEREASLLYLFAMLDKQTKDEAESIKNLDTFNQLMIRFTPEYMLKSMAKAFLGVDQDFLVIDQFRMGVMSLLQRVAQAEKTGISYSTSLINELSVAELISFAENNVAYTHALVNLTPFIINGIDYSHYNKKGELTKYNEQTKQGALTKDYLNDRADMFVNFINVTEKMNEHTTDKFRFASIDGLVSYRDESAKIHLVGKSSSKIEEHTLVIFGTDQDDASKQLNNMGYHNSKIYAGAGNDTLSINGVTDQSTYYIEGGMVRMYIILVGRVTLNHLILRVLIIIVLKIFQENIRLAI